MTRYRITVWNTDIELQGYIDVASMENLLSFSQAMRDIGTVIASEADDDYNPFAPVDDDPEAQWLCKYCGHVIPGEVSSQPCPTSPDFNHRRGERWQGD